MQTFAPMRRNLASALLSAFVSCRRHDHARCLQYDCRSGSGRQRHRQGRDNRRREGQARALTYRSDAAGYTGDHDGQAVAKTARQRRNRRPPEIAPCQHRRAGQRLWRAVSDEAAEATSILRGPVAASPPVHRRGMRLGDDAPRASVDARPECPGQQAATLACVRRNAAQQTGDAVGGTERPQSLGVGRTEQTPGGDRDTAGTTEQIGAPVLRASRIAGSASASRASISASRSPRSSSPASIAARSGSATSWRRCAPSTTSRHHCSRISASGGSDTASRARASSWLNAYSVSSASRLSGGANSAVRNRSGSCRRTSAAIAWFMRPRWRPARTRASLTRSGTGHS